MKIMTISIPKSYLKALDRYKNRSEIVRIALKRFVEKELEYLEDLQDYMPENLVEEILKKEKVNKKIPVKKENRKKEKRYDPEFKQLTQPKVLHKIFPRELLINHAISHLAEVDWFLSRETLCDLLGVGDANLSRIMWKINKKVPQLIIHGGNGFPGYKLNREKFEELLKRMDG